MVGQADFGGECLDLFAIGAVVPVEQDREGTTVFFEREEEIGKDGLVFEHGGALEFAADPGAGDLGLVHLQEGDGFVAPDDAALVGAGLAGDDVHEGGFARPVGADDGAHLGLADLEGEVVDRLEAVKGDGDAGDFEKGTHASASCS